MLGSFNRANGGPEVNKFIITLVDVYLQVVIQFS